MLTPAQVTQAKAVLDTLPAEMSVEALLKWLHERSQTFRPERYLYIRSIPVLDDLRDPLDTLVRWDGFTGAQLGAGAGADLERDGRRGAGQHHHDRRGAVLPGDGDRDPGSGDLDRGRRIGRRARCIAHCSTGGERR